MKFRTAIALTITLELALALIIILLVVSVMLKQAAYRGLSKELMRGRAVTEDLLRYRWSLHRAESRMLADEPRLKAVVATDDVSRATVQGVLLDLRRALRCDLLMLTDSSGRLIADTGHAEDENSALEDSVTVRDSLLHGEAEDVWLQSGHAVQVHARRLSYGAMTVGAVVVGYRLDDTVADAIAQQLGALVVIASHGKVVARSRSIEPRVSDLVAASLSSKSAFTVAPAQSVELQHHRYLMTTASLPTHQVSQSLHYAILMSLDEAETSARELRNILYLITVLALCCALFTASWLSLRLSRPVDALVRFTQDIAIGKLQPTELSGMQEVRLLGSAMNKMVGELAASRIQTAEQTRLAKELEIAQRIQVSILPRDFAIPGLQVAAVMLPASEVGGDYYDVIVQPDGCWLSIGDVAGHGLPAGMVMFMVQSSFSALVRSSPVATPKQLVCTLNRCLFDSIRNRLGTDEHVTLTAARYFQDGRLVFAGAHEVIILMRAATGQCELVETPGTWLGIIEDVTHATVDTTVQLQEGDIAVLYSDGLTEAMDAQGEQFGIERLCAALSACASLSPDAIHTHLMAAVMAWSIKPADDITLVVLRQKGVHG